MIQSKYIAAIAAALQFVSFFGMETAFAAAMTAYIGALMAIYE